MIMDEEGSNGLVTKGLRPAQSNPGPSGHSRHCPSYLPVGLLGGSYPGAGLKPGAVGSHSQGSLWLQVTAE